MNILDYLLLAAVAAGLRTAFRALRRGKGRCGGEFAACPMAGQCKKETGGPSDAI